MKTIKGPLVMGLCLVIGIVLVAAASGCATTGKTASAAGHEQHAQAGYHDSTGARFVGEPGQWTDPPAVQPHVMASAQGQ